MTELNKDGLIPGQEVDFATLQRIQSSRTPELQAEQSKNLQTKPVATVARERKAKALNNG